MHRVERAGGDARSGRGRSDSVWRARCRSCQRCRRRSRPDESATPKACAITRVATGADERVEHDLLIIAEHSTAHHVEKVCRLYRKASTTTNEQRRARGQQSERSLRSYVDDDGMVVIEARLPPSEGARVLHALDRAQRLVDAEQHSLASDAMAGNASAEVAPGQAWDRRTLKMS